MPTPGLTVLESELDRLDDVLRPWVRRIGDVAERARGAGLA